jgi:hypothetical protein
MPVAKRRKVRERRKKKKKKKKKKKAATRLHIDGFIIIFFFFALTSCLYIHKFITDCARPIDALPRLGLWIGLLAVVQRRLQCRFAHYKNINKQMKNDLNLND